MRQNNPIHLIITGGTLDKDYHPLTGELFFADSHLPDMLTQANSTLSMHSQTLYLKDSLAMTDADRAEIEQACDQSRHNHIVITHGTDTLVKTAQQLQQNPKLAHKTIVLTGAMRPFKLGNSDALFNLGSAFMAVQLKQQGVYITMNGQCFEADKVTKNLQLGQFEEMP